MRISPCLTLEQPAQNGHGVERVAARIHALCALSLLGASVCIPAAAQSVISARSGVVHFSEGSVLLDGKPIEHQPGKFDSLRNGSELRTQDGRAEILLAPAVFLRLSGNSAIRMISNDLTNSRVELLSGSAILEASQAPSDAHVTVALKRYEVNLSGPGSIRLDAEPPQAAMIKGDATIGAGTEKTAMKEGQTYDLTGSNPALAQKAKPANSALEEWANKRDGAIETDNKSADKVTDDLDVAGDWEDQTDGLGAAIPYSGSIPYTGIPYTGIPSLPSTPGNSLGSVAPYQLPVNPVTPLYQYGYSSLANPYLYPYGVGAYPYIGAPGAYVPLYVRTVRPIVGVHSTLPTWRTTHLPGSTVVHPVIGSRPIVGVTTPHPMVVVPHPPAMHLGGRR